MIPTTITGTWCSGVSFASHAESREYKSQWLHRAAAAVLCKRACAVRIVAMRENHRISWESKPGYIDGNDVFYHRILFIDIILDTKTIVAIANI